MTDLRDHHEVPELTPEESEALSAWKTPEPPDGFADRVVAAWSAERAQQSPSAPEPAPAHGRRRRTFLFVGAGIAASLVAATLGGLLVLTRDAASPLGVGAEQSIALRTPSYAPALSSGSSGGVVPSPPPMLTPSTSSPVARDQAASPSRPRPGRMGPQNAGPAAEPPSGERYRDWGVNGWVPTMRDRQSTFAIDVDTASYAIARRKILSGEAVPPESVRVEEFLNYFRYDDPAPTDGNPFAVTLEAAPSPYSPDRDILRVAVHARTVPLAQRKPAHLVFLVDVSGSMDSPDKLPLAQRSLRILTSNLREGDTVALVTYAGSTRVVLEPTGIGERTRIVAAIDELSAGGSTAMGSGLELAYRLAVRQVRPGVVSRIIVLSDGDANVGATSHEEILRTVQGYAREGVTISTVGFGMGNYHDVLMEQLADRANGNNYYIDTPFEARRVFEEQLGGTLEVVAQDVKIQVEFDPRVVDSYRLVGYENRDIADEDFRNDRVDAGEIGSGHTVNALYEIRRLPGAQGPLATVRLRAKAPGGSVANEWETPLPASALRPSMEQASADLRFATAVMGLAEILRASPEARGWRLDTVAMLARSAIRDGDRDRQELLELVQTLARRTDR